MNSSLSLLYFPTAVLLGALHALEPGHAKSLTAAYLIGVKGTRRDAVLLGVSVAVTHSFVVVALCAVALWLGKEALDESAYYWLQVGSGIIVVLLGSWMLYRRWPRAVSRDSSAHDHDHDHDHDDDHDHDHHDHGHDHSLPDYVARGERPTLGQIVAFGAAGGLMPCPSAVTVMLLAISAGQAGLGMLTVFGFSLGLAISLVLIGLLVVASVQRIGVGPRLGWISRRAPLLAAVVVILSGAAALAMAHFYPHSHE